MWECMNVCMYGKSERERGSVHNVPLLLDRFEEQGRPVSGDDDRLLGEDRLRLRPLLPEEGSACTRPPSVPSVPAAPTPTLAGGLGLRDIAPPRRLTTSLSAPAGGAGNESKDVLAEARPLAPVDSSAGLASSPAGAASASGAASSSGLASSAAGAANRGSLRCCLTRVSEASCSSIR